MSIANAEGNELKDAELAFINVMPTKAKASVNGIINRNQPIIFISNFFITRLVAKKKFKVYMTHTKVLYDYLYDLVMDAYKCKVYKSYILYYSNSIVLSVDIVFEKTRPMKLYSSDGVGRRIHDQREADCAGPTRIFSKLWLDAETVE